jgi:hypothetical protein
MADETFTVQMGEEDYRIVGPDGDEGVMVPYGTLATLCEEGEPGQPPAVYFCLIMDPDDENPKVWCVDSVSKMTSESEECDFPPEVVAAQRALDEALEKAEAEEESVIDVKATPEVN